MILAYKYKLRVSSFQEAMMSNWLSMLRSHYNFCLRDRIEAYEQVKSPKLGNYSDLKTKAEFCPLTCSISNKSQLGSPFKKSGKKRNALEMQSSELPFLKKARPWYKNIHSTVLQQNLRRLEKAFANFFDGRGYPKFKTRQKFKSFSYPPNQVKLENNKIYLPSIGWMRFFKSRNIPDGFNLKTVTIRSLADGWYVSIRIENKDIPQSKSKDVKEIKTVMGCDLGIKKLLALSNGELIENPQFEKRLSKRKTIRQRRASRKKRGSSNQRKAYAKLARLDQKIVNQREDYQWKIAHHLVRLADFIVLEDLNIQGMIRKCRAKQDENGKFLKNGQSAKRALNRLIRDCSWGNLTEKIESVAAKFGSICLKVNPKFTSQKCSHCGHIQKENRNKERFLCLNCGFLADADVQASINIGMKGLKTLGISPSKLLMVNQKVTPKPESTGSRNREKSVLLETEPGNPQQLSLFEWVNGEAIPC
ncbi:transposase [Crocosphaera sp.]|uniref:RNA-guided endonuclease InsQ/TnpB family protein n=1 Tax=Crocosphaera sp. TaxID=2729996 RepID=UPI00262C62D1|nr:transposase [Crocosphaera sp.]MDJ0580500.1 transposase [Crocosphaera sp.]